MALLVRARLPLLPRLLSAAALVPLCAWVLLSILVLPLGATARYLVDDPAGAPRQYAEVTIVAPGAMGRVRYHAVEQYALVELDPVARLSWVTGRDSTPSGSGTYGYLVRDYLSGTAPVFPTGSGA